MVKILMYTIVYPSIPLFKVLDPYFRVVMLAKKMYTDLTFTKGGVIVICISYVNLSVLSQCISNQISALEAVPLLKNKTHAKLI